MEDNERDPKDVDETNDGQPDGDDARKRGAAEGADDHADDEDEPEGGEPERGEDEDEDEDEAAELERLRKQNAELSEAILELYGEGGAEGEGEDEGGADDDAERRAQNERDRAADRRDEGERGDDLGLGVPEFLDDDEEPARDRRRERRPAERRADDEEPDELDERISGLRTAIADVAAKGKITPELRAANSILDLVSEERRERKRDRERTRREIREEIAFARMDPRAVPWVRRYMKSGHFNSVEAAEKAFKYDLMTRASKLKLKNKKTSNKLAKIVERLRGKDARNKALKTSTTTPQGTQGRGPRGVERRPSADTVRAWTPAQILAHQTKLERQGKMDELDKFNDKLRSGKIKPKL